MSNSLNSTPCWKKDFPIRQKEEHAVTRREFTRFFGVASLALFGGASLGAGPHFFESGKNAGAVPRAIAAIDELKVGGYKLFRYPTENDPCILLRLRPDKYVAFSQSCTHLTCPVHFQADHKQLVCPCHEGYFSAEDGRVLAGPPPRPLTQHRVEIRDARVWVMPAATANI